MSLIDIIFWGWYYILHKTIYSNVTEKEYIGAREHSFFITFLFHGINFWTILSYLMAKYFNASIPTYFIFSLIILIMVLGYLIYFKGKRVIKVVSYSVKTTKAILFVIVSIIYVAASVYFMLEVGNYVRAQLTAG